MNNNQPQETTIKNAFKDFLNQSNSLVDICRNEFETLYAFVKKMDTPTSEMYFLDDPQLPDILMEKFLDFKRINTFDKKMVKKVISSYLAKPESRYDESMYSSRIGSSQDKVLYIRLASNQAIRIDPQKISVLEGYAQKGYFLKGDAKSNYRQGFLNFLKWNENNDEYEAYHKQNPHSLTPDQCQKINDDIAAILQNTNPFVAFYGKFNLSEDHQALMITWMVSTLLPNVQKVALEITGPRSSGKTSFQKAIKQILDPTSVYSNDLPSTTKSLSECAYGHHLISFDNVEKLTKVVQLQLFDLLKGAPINLSHLSKTTDIVLELQRPVIWNALNTVETEMTLNDAVLSIELPDSRFDINGESSFQIDLQTHLSIYLPLLQMIQTVLKEWDTDNTEKQIFCPPAMQDFYKVGQILSKQHFPKPDELQRLTPFELEFDAFLKQRAENVVRQSVVGDAFLSFIKSSEQTTYTLKVIGWHDRIQPYQAEGTNWPKHSRATSTQLDAIAPWLEYLDIQFFKSDALGQPEKTVGKQQANYYRTLKIKRVQQ